MIFDLGLFQLKDRYIIVQEYDDSPFEGTIYYIKTDDLVSLYLGVGGYCDINCIKSKRSSKFVNSHMNKIRFIFNELD